MTAFVECYVKKGGESMTGQIKVTKVTIIFACAFLILLSSTFLYFSKRVASLEEKLKQADHELIEARQDNQTELNKYKVKLEEIVGEFETLANELEEKKTEIETYKKYLDLEEYESKTLDQAKEISSATPLDFKTSLIVLDYAEKFDLKPSFILSVIDLESNFVADEVGGAMDRGYMQIIPSTERWLVKEFGDKLGFNYDPSRIFESEYNIGLGTAYLGLLKDAYGENYDRILSEYNRGPSNLKKYFIEHKTYATAYSRVILKKENKYLTLN